MGNDVTTRVGNYMPNTHPYLGNYTTADNLNGTTTASGCRGGSPAAWSTERVTMHDDVITEALNRQDGACYCGDPNKRGKRVIFVYTDMSQ
jgi:hypothetical protein